MQERNQDSAPAYSITGEPSAENRGGASLAPKYFRKDQKVSRSLSIFLGKPPGLRQSCR